MKYSLKAITYAVAATLLSAAPLKAQDFGSQPIRMIVGVAAGGATDVTARIIAQKLQQTLGTPVIVENRTGAFFEAAYREVTNAQPDGHTIFMISHSVSLILGSSFISKLPTSVVQTTPVVFLVKGFFRIFPMSSKVNSLT